VNPLKKSLSRGGRMPQCDRFGCGPAGRRISFVGFHVPVAISDCRNTARNWSIMATSISRAGIWPSGQGAKRAPCLSTVWLTESR